MAITGYNILQDTKTIKDIKTKQNQNSQDILDINEHLGDKVNYTDFTPIVTTGTGLDYIATIPTNMTEITIVPHINNLASATLNGIAILDREGNPIEKDVLKINIPTKLVRVGSNFFIASGGGGSNIKSIQHGVFSPTYSVRKVTIDTIDINNSIILINGINGKNYNPNVLAFIGKIIDSNTIEFISGNLIVSGVPVSWTVIEFNNIKSLQKIELSCSNISTDVSINKVNVNKSLIFISFRVNTNSLRTDDMTSMPYFLNDTTIRIEANNPSSGSTNSSTTTRTAYVNVIEFK